MIPAPAQNLYLHRESPVPSASRSAPIAQFNKQGIFSALTEEQQKRLIAGARVLRFGRGERIVRQNEEGSSMFLILEGSAEVLVASTGEELHVADLRAGEAFGEMSLLTGEKRSASVIARTDCELWEIDRAVLMPILQDNPELARHLSELLAHRKVETDGLLAKQTPTHLVENSRNEYAKGFLRRITALFEI